MVSAESRQTVRTPSTVGRRSTTYCTSLSKTILAFLPRQQVAEFVRAHALKRYTHKTITRLSLFDSELRRARELGYAVDDEELEDGLRCIGDRPRVRRLPQAPVPGVRTSHDELLGALLRADFLHRPLGRLRVPGNEAGPRRRQSSDVAGNRHRNPDCHQSQQEQAARNEGRGYGRVSRGSGRSALAQVFEGQARQPERRRGGDPRIGTA